MKKTILITLVAALLVTAMLTPVVLLAQEEDLTFETVTKMVVALTEEFTDLQEQVEALTERSTDLRERVDAIDELLPETPVGFQYEVAGDYCPMASETKSADSYVLHLYEEKWPDQNLPVEYRITNVWQHKFLGITAVKTEASWYRDGSSLRRVRFLMEYWRNCELLGAIWED